MIGSDQVFIVVLFFIFISLSYSSTNISNNILMKNVAGELAADLEVIKNDELGIKYIENLYSTFDYTPVIIDVNETVRHFAHNLETKIGDMFGALLRAKTAIENMQTLDNTTKTRSSLQPCIPDKNMDLNTQVSKMCGTLIGLVLHKPPKDQLRVDFVLQKIKSSAKNIIKQQYFLSEFEMDTFDDAPFSFCTERDHSLLWNKFISRINYNSRKIVILFDHGSAVNKKHLLLMKTIAIEMISYLNEKDEIAFLAVSNDWDSPTMYSDCLLPNQVIATNLDLPSFYPANDTNKKIFTKFIKALSIINAPTNHTLGLLQALKVIAFNKIENDTVMILYISRGLSSSSETKQLLINLAETTISTRFFINTIAIVDELNPLQEFFLKDVALQDYVKYNITTDTIPEPGLSIVVNDTDKISFAAAYFFTKYTNSSYNLEKSLSLPMWDYKSNDLSISFTLGTFVNNQFGLLGVDVYFANLAEDIIYFSSSQHHSYTFLIDLNGHVIMHPSYPSPTTIKQQLHFVDISNFEKVPNFHIIRRRLLNEFQGTHIVSNYKTTLKYLWHRVGEWYVICLVVPENFTPVRPYLINWPLNATEAYSIKLVYHSLENTEGSKLCRHLNQIATLDAGSLYLSSSCFKSLTSHDSDDPVVLQNYMTYLQDNSRLLINPGLKDHIKDEVAALAHILNFLKNQQMSSFKSRFIVRRYVASYSGVLQMFPGSILDKGLEPTKRPWFLQAIEHKSKLVLIPPYLDQGGAGYIVTLAYATSNVVVAMDLTYGYVFRMILKRMPFCSSLNITCFLMDDRGYLIYHPNLINPNGHGPVEKQHIVHKESLVANDILNHKYFIQKKLCNSYGGGTIQRYYKLNTSSNNVLANIVHGDGEHCVTYHIVAIPNTNIFIGMVNATCSIVVTFCPCSIVDRLCLNCNRMEQKECECPCECPLEQDQCSDVNQNVIDNPSCTWYPEHVSLAAHFRDEPPDEMRSCFPMTCTLEKTHFGCLGITGCEWCKYDVDGSKLNEPFCASLSTCFNGIVGAVTPYKPHEILSLQDNEVPVSFIILFLLGVGIIFGLVYIYHRLTSQQTNERLYLSSAQENHLRMSDLNLNDNYNALNSNHRDKLLEEDKPDPVSPYCVSSNYRRQAPTTESDNGYSTMTQHDESEHLSLAPVEIDPLNDDLASDSTSIHTSLSSKPYRKNELPPFTRIPKRNNCIIVPVTVHRNMELT